MKNSEFLPIAIFVPVLAGEISYLALPPSMMISLSAAKATGIILPVKTSTARAAQSLRAFCQP